MTEACQDRTFVLDRNTKMAPSCLGRTINAVLNARLEAMREINFLMA